MTTYPPGTTYSDAVRELDQEHQEALARYLAMPDQGERLALVNRLEFHSALYLGVRLDLPLIELGYRF